MIKSHQRRFRSRSGIPVERTCGAIEALVDRSETPVTIPRVLEFYRKRYGVLNLWEAINKLLREGTLVLQASADPDAHLNERILRRP